MRKPFTALVWKEALEVTRFSVPLFFVYSVMFYVVLSGFSWVDGDIDPIANLSTFGLVTAVVGAIMGFTQTFREGRGDRWAFAIHRPIGRTAIFGAKTLVGSLSLIATAGIPYAVAQWWLATPGHRAVPFDIHRVLPGIADLLIGVTFYSAGLLAGARRSAAFTRGTGFVLAIAAGVVASGINNFRDAFLLLVGAIAVLLAAGWATFASGDDFDGQTVAGRAANVLAAAPAAAAAVLIAFNVAMWIIPQRNANLQPGIQPPEATVLGDGKIGLIKRSKDSDRNGYRKVTSVTDLQGKPMPEYADSNAGERLSYDVISSGPISADTASRFGFFGGEQSYRNARFWITPLRAMSVSQRWYYERTLGLISIFDTQTRRQTGWVSPDGFTAYSQMPGSRFPGEMRDDFTMTGPGEGMLVVSGGVYVIDGLMKPRLLFRAPEGEHLLATARGGLRGGQAPRPGHWGSFSVYVTDKRTYVVGAGDSTPQIVVDHDTSINLARVVSVFRAVKSPNASTFVWYRSQYSIGPIRPAAGVPFDSVNHVTEFQETTPSPVARYAFVADPYEDDRSAGGRRIAVAYGGTQDISFGAPIASFVAFELIRSDKPIGPKVRTALLLTLLFNVALMVLAWWLCRRHGFSGRRTTVWVVLTAIGGPVTVVIMWLLMEWPAKERCPSCGKQRVVTRERCEHCGAPFAPPTPDGTELILAN